MVGISLKFLPFLSAHIWLVLIAVILIITSLLSWFESIIYNKLCARFSKTPYIVDNALLFAFHPPFQMLIWLVSTALVIQMLGFQLGLGTRLSNYVHAVHGLILIISVVWFTLRFIHQMESGIIFGKKKSRFQDKTTIHAVAMLLRIAILVLGILFALQALGISIAALLTLGGVGGLAVGFAAKDTLTNFLGGMMIYWDRPFSVGDWIRSPDRNIEGTVKYIGWRLTHILTTDKRPLYVPNGLFSTISIENPSRMTHRKIKTSVGVRYEDARKISGISAAIEAMLQEHKDIDNEQNLYVCLNEFAPSSLNLLICAFTRVTFTGPFLKLQQELLLKIIEIIAQHGGECAFPTQTLYLPELTQQLQERYNYEQSSGISNGAARNR